MAAGRCTPSRTAARSFAATLRTGKEIWTQRFHGTYSASPVLAGDKLYLVNEDGETTVVQWRDKPERFAVNSLGETMLASPAVADGCIFSASDRHLYCVGGPVTESRLLRPGRIG